MAISGKTLASLLARAYMHEFSEENVISETLMHISDDFWDPLFRILRDCVIHRQMIEELIKLLQYDIRDFREYSEGRVEIKTYEFKDEFISEMLEEISKIEAYAMKYYSQLLNLDFLAILQEYGAETVDKIKNTLKKLVKWEENHVRVVQDLRNKL